MLGDEVGGVVGGVDGEEAVGVVDGDEGGWVGGRDTRSNPLDRRGGADIKALTGALRRQRRSRQGY